MQSQYEEKWLVVERLKEDAANDIPRQKNCIEKVGNTTASKATKRASIFREIRKSEQAKIASKRDSKTNKANWTEKKNAKRKSVVTLQGQ